MPRLPSFPPLPCPPQFPHLGNPSRMATVRSTVCPLPRAPLKEARDHVSSVPGRAEWAGLFGRSSRVGRHSRDGDPAAQGSGG